MTQSIPGPVPVLPPRKKPSRSRKRLIAVALAIVLLAVAGVAAYITLAPSSRAQANSSEALSGLKAVAEGSYNEYQFAVPSAKASPEINCTFAVKGGSGNVMQVLLMNSTVFSQWSSDFANDVIPGPLPYLYSEGRVNSGSFIVPVSPGGTYYLVFNDVQAYNEVVQVSAAVVSGG